MDAPVGAATGRRRVLPGAALLAASIGVLVGCGTQHPTISELEAVPAATSSYPGSVAIGGHGAREGEHTLVSSSGGMLFTTYCTTASPSQVSQWFASELGRNGWTAESNPVGTTNTSVVATEAWDRGERVFTLELLSPAYVERLGASQGQPCSSGYRTVVQ
ncbi:MAG TPA: hypothetical protein VHO29_13695 [Marmoricola sp.]|nr:hypothetical protein [Marmoricola sp.]